MKRILLVLLSTMLLAGVGCEKKAEKSDEDPAAAAQEAKQGEADEEKAEPEEPAIPEAVTAVDCSTEPEGDELAVSDKSAEGDEAAEGEEADDALSANSPLLDPSQADETAPAVFWAKLDTTQGPIVVRFEREWAPKGVDRVYNLIKMGYYEDIAFFRVIGGFMAQFGIHGNPKVNEVWSPNPKDLPKDEYEKKNAAATIEDDPVEESNTRGKVTFAKRGQPDSRTVQLFINYGNNARLDESGFAPIGEVAKCMDNVDELHAGYGEGAPRGQGPSQEKLNKQGNAYLEANFPKLDYIRTTEIIAQRDE